MRKLKYNVKFNTDDIVNVKRIKDINPPATQRIPFVGRTQAGTYINSDNALTISTVFACIRYLSQSIAKLPWVVRRKTDMGFEELTTSPVHKLLNKRVSDEFSSYQFRETLLSWALRWGNGYAEIERDTAGRPIALHPMHPAYTTVHRNRETGRLYYEYSNQIGGNVQLDLMDVFHIRGFGESPVGLNIMQYAAESLGWAKAVQLFGAGFFGNGGNLSAVITMKNALSPEGLEVMRDSFNDLYGGPRNSNKVAFLDNEMTYQPIGTEPDKGQFIDTNYYLVDEVCRWFGVPPHKVYHLLRATFSNIEHQSIEVVVDSLTPWACRFNDEANYKLLNNRPGNVTSYMDFNELLEGDSVARTAYYNTMRNMGAMNSNEIRMKEGFNSIGEAGDKYLTQSQYIPLENVGTEPKPEELTEDSDEMEISSNDMISFYELMADLKDYAYVDK